MESGKRGERNGDRGQGREGRGKGIVTCGWIIHKTHSKHFDFNSPALCRRMSNED